MPREGVGVALGAQVGHVGAYRGSPDGSLIHTVFTKKCQKRSKKGVPPILTTLGEEFTFLGTLISAWPPDVDFVTSFPSCGDKNRTSSRNFEVGVQGR